MKYRTIREVIPSQLVNMGGIILDQPLPTRTIEQIDPFLLIHHWNKPLKGGKKQHEVGVGAHPHRGFSPVTFIFKGEVEHRDSVGNTAVVKAGGTQWKHAGSGIVHSERPSKELAEKGGDQEFIQFWVNTPAKYKMDEPYYLPLSAKDTPIIKKGNSEIGVVAGDFEGIKGPAKTYSPQTLLRIEGKKGDEFSLDVPQSYNSLIYLLNGQMEIDNRIVKTKDLVWFNNDEGEIKVEVEEDVTFILLSGEPIGEEITSYGPFVMNTEEEIRQALYDAQIGKMGVLEEEFV